MIAGVSAATVVPLVSLVLQNVGYVILLRTSRMGEHRFYIPSTVVLLGEVTKILISLGMLTSAGISPAEIVRFFRETPYSDHFALCVPAFLYMIQNNLYFTALQNLDAATYQLLAQTKILTTGIFSYLFLRKHLSMTQWLALILLLTGCTIAQLPPDCDEPVDVADPTGFSDQMKGVFACIIIAVLSGSAAVYTEKFLKKDPTRHVAYSQIQLAFWSLVTNGLNVLYSDYSVISEKGFLFGYDFLTWSLIVVSAGGGILVSVVVKNTSSLAKTYAVSCAIFLTGVYNHYIMDEHQSLVFWLAAVVVAISVILYTISAPPPAAAGTGAGAGSKGTSSGGSGDAGAAAGGADRGDVKLQMVPLLSSEPRSRAD